MNAEKRHHFVTGTSAVCAPLQHLNNKKMKLPIALLACCLLLAVFFFPGAGQNQTKLQNQKQDSGKNPAIEGISNSWPGERLPIEENEESKAKQPSINAHWWDKPEQLNNFFLVYDHALQKELEKVEERRSLEQEFSDSLFDFNNAIPAINRWTSMIEDNSQYVSTLEQQPFHILSFCLGKFEDQKNNRGHVPPVDLRTSFWNGVFLDGPYNFHPKHVLQLVHNLDEMPNISPDLEGRLLELQLKHMVKMAGIRASTNPIFAAYNRAISNFPEPLPADSDLFPGAIIEANNSISDAIESYLEDIKALEFELPLE